MPTITLRRGEYIEQLTSHDDTLYTFRYIPVKQRSEWTAIVRDAIVRELEDGTPIATIQQGLSHVAKDLSIRVGNHLSEKTHEEKDISA